MSTREPPNPPKRPIVVSGVAWETAKKMSRALGVNLNRITSAAILEKFDRLDPNIRTAILTLEAATAKAA